MTVVDTVVGVDADVAGFDTVVGAAVVGVASVCDAVGASGVAARPGEAHERNNS